MSGKRREYLVEKYNRMFNNTVVPTFDGSYLSFPGMNPEIELKPHQKDAVARMMQGKNTLLHHCVGAGKTYEIAAACMKMKEIGLVQKPLIVVPNHLVVQWANEFKDGSYHDVYYYYCGNSKADRGHLCDYRAKLRKTDIEPYVVEAIKDLVRDEQFAQAIQDKIGVKVDTSKIDEEIKKYELKLKEIDLNKVRLENEMDCMPIDAKFRERKLHDMSLRLDSLYETMVDLEELIEDAKLRKQGIEMESISLENIYEILRTFEEIYDIMDDKEQKTLITYLIKEIQINPNDQNDCVMPLKSIEFNFPLYKGGKEVRKIFWETQSSVETLVCLVRKA